MSDIKKLMEAFELVLNEEDDAADNLMHQYFVGLARKINEEYEDAELEEADLDMDMEDDLVGEIESDQEEIDSEEGVAEDDFEDDEAMDDLEDDMETTDEEDLPALVMDLKDAIEELEAKFDELAEVEDEEHGDEYNYDEGDDDDMEMDDMDMDDMDAEEDYEDEDYDDEDEMTEESWELDEDEDSMDESVELQKVSDPANQEGHEVGKGGSFQTNTKQNLKPRGELKGTDANPNISSGGEASGYKEIDKQVKEKPKGELTDVDNVVSSSKSVQKKQPEQGKGDKEVGAGKGVSREKDSLISKKVR